MTRKGSLKWNNEKWPRGKRREREKKKTAQTRVSKTKNE